jgi:hypothetical protein
VRQSGVRRSRCAGVCLRLILACTRCACDVRVCMCVACVCAYLRGVRVCGAGRDPGEGGGAPAQDPRQGPGPQAQPGPRPALARPAPAPVEPWAEPPGISVAVAAAASRRRRRRAVRAVAPGCSCCADTRGSCAAEGPFPMPAPRRACRTVPVECGTARPKHRPRRDGESAGGWTGRLCARPPARPLCTSSDGPLAA